MKVLKFGGTSVGTAKSLANVKKIVDNISEPTVVVVSALGGLTDMLIATAKLAASGNFDYNENILQIKNRHHAIVEDVIISERKEDCLKQIDPLLEELHRTYDGLALIKELSEKTLDKIVSFGERISSIIVSRMLSKAIHVNSLDLIKTEKWFGKNIADTALTTANIIEKIHPEAGIPVVAGGFISSDRDSGEITNLGRGGSDFTAALVAAALDADLLEIWTDVDGFMTSDPRIIPDAKIIPQMSFVESMELCNFGAKVIYPPTIYPVFHKNIPIKILNTFNPEAPGTLIRDFESLNLDGSERVRGISMLRDTCVVDIAGEYSRNVAFINSRAFNALAKKGIGVYLVSQGDDSSKFSFALKENDLDNALAVLEEEFAPEKSLGLIDNISSRRSLTIIAVVGHNITIGQPLAPRVINTLMRNSIEPAGYSEGASRTTVTFVVNSEMAQNALQLIHSLFYN